MRYLKIMTRGNTYVGVNLNNIYGRIDDEKYPFYYIYGPDCYGTLLNALGDRKNCYLSFCVSSEAKAFNILKEIVL